MCKELVIKRKFKKLNTPIENLTDIFEGEKRKRRRRRKRKKREEKKAKSKMSQPFTDSHASSARDFKIQGAAPALAQEITSPCGGPPSVA